MFLDGKNTESISPCPNVVVPLTPSANVIKVKPPSLSNVLVAEPVLNTKLFPSVPALEAVNCRVAVEVEAVTKLEARRLISSLKFSAVN